MVPESQPMASIQEEEVTPVTTTVVKEAKPTYNVRTGELIQTDKSKMANTMPEWWGHQEAEPHVIRKEESQEPTKVPVNKTQFNHHAHEENHYSKVHEESKVTKEEKQDAYSSSWISCKLI